ncbi:proteoglycan 4-like [Parambassis ranga]|uniref:Proteoglycan 4-like n=1 Tax=Parambassis ranga TaxID=210632 RepID=A0A6P7I590_9TELE|nr:proteoglycan 4-like [Parambassis ranga]
MRLTALCVCGTLLAFSSLSWITAHSDQGVLLGDKGFGPCTATFRPQGPCRQGQDGSTCPYLFSLPPLTVQLPQQLRQLEEIVTDLQKLKDSVDELREMCADCTVSQTEKECGKQREREHEKSNERKGMIERLQENNKDLRQECATDSGTEKKIDENSGKRMNVNEKETKKKEAERKIDAEVIKENEKGEEGGKTQKEGAKEKDNLRPTQVPTAGGNEKTGETQREKVVDKSNRETEPDRNAGKDNPKGYKKDKKENEKEKKINTNVKNKEKPEESDHRMGKDKTKKNTETSDRTKMPEDNDEHTNEEQRRHRDEKEKEMEKGIKVEQNNEKPKQSESTGHTEKEKTIKEGEVEVDGRETGIKTESVQSDSDGELASSTAIETTDFVSISPTPHSTISLASRPDSTDSNQIFTSSLPSPPLPNSTVDLITDLSHKTITAFGPTQSTGLGEAGISEPTSPSTTITTMGGPGQETASTSTRSNSISKVGPGAGFWGHLSSTASTTTTTTTYYQKLYTTAFSGARDQMQGTAKKNISSTTKTSMKPMPGLGLKPGAKHKPGIKPEADKKLKNPKNDRKPDQALSPDKKTKLDQKQKPSQQKPTTDKSKPGKQPKQVPKPNQRTVQRPTSREKPETVNATKPEEKVAQLPKGNKPDPKQKPDKSQKVEEKTELEQRFHFNNDSISKITETATFTSKPDQIFQTESTENDEQSTPDPKAKVSTPGQDVKSDQVDPLPDHRHRLTKPKPDLNLHPKPAPEPQTKTTETTSFTSKPDKPPESMKKPEPRSNQVSTPDPVIDLNQYPKLVPEPESTEANSFISKPDSHPTPDPNSNQDFRPKQKLNPDKKPKPSQKMNQKHTPDHKLDLKQSESSTSKPDQKHQTESMGKPDPTPEPESNQNSTPAQKINLDITDPLSDQRSKPSQTIIQKPKLDPEFDLNQYPKPVPAPESTEVNSFTLKPDQTSQPESMEKSGEITTPDPNAKQISTPGQVKAGRADPPPGHKTNQRPKPDQMSGPETSKPDQQLVTESMKTTDENPTPEPKSNKVSTLGQKIKSDRADPPPNQKPKPSPKIPKINQKPKPGQVPKPHQKPGKSVPNTKTKPKTHQGPKTPRTSQIPNLEPKSLPDKVPKPESNKTAKSRPPPQYRPTIRTTVKPGATPVQRPKPAVQPKPNPKTTIHSDPLQISWTTSDNIKNSQTSMPPTSGAIKQIADVTHTPRGSEFSPSVRKRINLGPKTSNRPETGPTPHRHTHTEDFTVSPNSRIMSDLKPQTVSQLPLTPVTTSPNKITYGIPHSLSVIPSTSPGSTTPTPKSDSSLQAFHNAEEPAPTIPSSSTRSQTTSILSPDNRSTTSAISGPKPPAAESSTPSARELRVKINQVAAFLNNSLIPNGRPPERHPKEQPEDTRPESTLTPSKVTSVVRDCSDHLLRGETNSGVYLVTPDLHSSSFPVFCDMERDGGGWTLLQRRQDGSVSFNRTWAEYRSGFGKLDGGEFWLGNNLIHLLTRDRGMVLRVELEDFDGVTEHAQYEQFKVANERWRYRLTVGGYSGTAGDALRFNKRYDHNNRAFTTPDRDHDRYPSGNCGAYYSSGWWFDACMAANLNGRYYVGRYKGVRDGIYWGTWHNISTEYYPTNERQSFKTVRMMIRPKGFAP